MTEKVNFPVSYDLRIIMEEHNLDHNIGFLKETLKQLGQTVALEKSRKSSGGRYASFRNPVTVASREALDQLYAALRQVPGVKYAV